MAGILDLIVKGGDFDSRFDKRVREQDMLRNLEAEIIGSNQTQPMPGLALSELEGEDFVSSMSDRTRAGVEVKSINRVELVDPIHLPGGQDFMFNNPSAVWASAEHPSRQILEIARGLKSQSGRDPLYIPWRMAPSGGDFSTTTGELMLGYASANMTKTTKKALDKAIRSYRTTGSSKEGRQVNAGLKIEGWKGIDDPSSVEVWRNTPDAVRKELMNMMDVEFRKKGGLSIGAARLINADPVQLVGRDAGIQNVGRIFSDVDIFESNHPSYPFAVPGAGVGVLRKADKATIFDLLPEARFGQSQRKVKDPANPTTQEIRALQMKPYAGTITEKILRRMEARGVAINSIAGLSGGALTFTLLSAGLVTPQEVEAGQVTNFVKRMAKADQMGMDTDQILYHGSTFDVEEFVPSSNTDNDFGTGTYLTVSPSDASRNYAGEGPDLTNRIDLLAERIQESLDDDWDLNPDFWDRIKDPEVFAKVGNLVDEFEENGDPKVLEEASRLAAKTILKGDNEGVIYPVFVNKNDFAVIGGTDSTFIEFDREQYANQAKEEVDRADFDSDELYEEGVNEYATELEAYDPESPIQSFADTLRYAGLNSEGINRAVDTVVGDGGIDLIEINDIVRTSYSEDFDTGELLNAGQIMQDVLSDLGYKGVIDNTAGEKFAGMGAGRMHAIVFPGDENLIRSIFAEFDPEKSGSPSILASAPPMLVPAAGIVALGVSEDAEAGPFKRGIENKLNERRRKRAKKQGFDVDTVYYHGADADITEFRMPSRETGQTKTVGTGVFMSSSPDTASSFAKAHSRTVYPVYLNKSDFLTVRPPEKGQTWGDLSVEGMTVELPDGTTKPANEVFDLEDISTDTDELARQARNQGRKGIIFKDIVDVGMGGSGEYRHVNKYLQDRGYDVSLPLGTTKESFEKEQAVPREVMRAARLYAKEKVFQPADTVVSFDPANIRSVNAEFDPENLGSRDILASGLVTAGGIAAMAPGEAEAMQKTIERVERDFPGLLEDSLTGAGDSLTGAGEAILDLLGDGASPLGRVSAPTLLESLSQDPLTAEQIKEAAERGAGFFDYEIKTPTGKKYREAVTTGVRSLFDYLSESGGSLDPVQFGFQEGVIPVLEALEPATEAYVEGTLDLDAAYRGEEDPERAKAWRESGEPFVRTYTPY